jgi:hypothetical protein
MLPDDRTHVTPDPGLTRDHLAGALLSDSVGAKRAKLEPELSFRAETWASSTQRSMDNFNLGACSVLVQPLPFGARVHLGFSNHTCKQNILCQVRVWAKESLFDSIHGGHPKDECR